MIKLITFILRFTAIFLIGGVCGFLSSILAFILWDKKYMAMLEMVMEDLFNYKTFK